MNDKCSNEICWTKQDFVKSYVNNNNNNNLDVNDLKMYFKPERPQKWKTNEREWLDTNNIDHVMERYE